MTKIGRITILLALGFAAAASPVLGLAAPSDNQIPAELTPLPLPPAECFDESGAVSSGGDLKRCAFKVASLGAAARFVAEGFVAKIVPRGIEGGTPAVGDVLTYVDDENFDWIAPSTIAFTTGITFEGATPDAFETTLDVVDPTADQTYRLTNTTAGTYAIIYSTLATNAQEVANSIWGVSGGLRFEGSGVDAFETTLTAANPTVGDGVYTLPDLAAASTVAVMATTLTTNAPDAANSVTGGTNQLIFEGSGVDAFETILTATNATVSDRTQTLQNASGTICLEATDCAFSASQALNAGATLGDAVTDVLTINGGIVGSATAGGNPALAVNACTWGAGRIVCEGSTDDTNETEIVWADATGGDNVLTVPNGGTGTFVVSVVLPLTNSVQGQVSIDADGIEGTHLDDTLSLEANQTITGEGAMTLGVAAGAFDLTVKMGDNAGAQKVSFVDSDSAEVASINSNGIATFVNLVNTDNVTQGNAATDFLQLATANAADDTVSQSSVLRFLPEYDSTAGVGVTSITTPVDIYATTTAPAGAASALVFDVDAVAGAEASLGATSGLTIADGLTVTAGTVALPAGEIGTAELGTGVVTANKLQAAADDLGGADVTVNLGNTNGAFNTNVTTDGTITATSGFVGNASTATALVGDPADCPPGDTWPRGVAASGAATCEQFDLGTDTAGNYAAGDGEAGNATGVACAGSCIADAEVDDNITITTSAAAAFNGGISVDSPAFVVADTTGAVSTSHPATFETGNGLLVDWAADPGVPAGGTLRGAYFDVSDVSQNATGVLIGAGINGPAVSAGDTEAVRITGAAWDTAVYAQTGNLQLDAGDIILNGSIVPVSNVDININTTGTDEGASASDINLTGGAGQAGDQGGTIELDAGNAGSGAGTPSGAILATAGDGAVDGSGGVVYIYAGSGGSASTAARAGGDVRYWAGAGSVGNANTTSGNGGVASIAGGNGGIANATNGTGGAGGDAGIVAGDGGARNAGTTQGAAGDVELTSGAGGAIGGPASPGQPGGDVRLIIGANGATDAVGIATGRVSIESEGAGAASHLASTQMTAPVVTQTGGGVISCTACTDMKGVMNVTPGGADSNPITLTFNKAFTTAPTCTVGAYDTDAAAALAGAQMPVIATTTLIMTLTPQANWANQATSFSYICIE